MARKRKQRPFQAAAKSFPQALREFLTPQVFKQVRQADLRRKQPRWDLHPLLYVLLLMSWTSGDSLPEQLESARSFYVASCSKRRRPGETFSGWEKAVAKLPNSVLRALAAALRARLLISLGERLWREGFIPVGCDGTRQECPRSEELKKRLGKSGKENSAPSVWNTTMVLLTVGVPWCWRVGRGDKSSERTHLLQMISLLPKASLLITDAGYVGFDLVQTLAENKEIHFLMRMSSQATFYVDTTTPLEDFCEGLVYYWPDGARKKGQAPVRGRLIRVRSKSKKDVWLFTNVEDAQRLSTQLAATFYRWRWENEGYFRTYKRTLKKVKLSGRTVRMVHREAEVSMIATQLLLAQGALAMPLSRGKASGRKARSGSDGGGHSELPMCSPRRVLLEIRRELRGAKCARSFGERLAEASRERRVRSTPKEKNVWPRRKPHKPPSPPRLLRLTDELKLQIDQHFQAA